MGLLSVKRVLKMLKNTFCNEKSLEIRVSLISSLLMPSCIRPLASVCPIAVTIANPQSLEEFSFCKLDIARGGSDLERPELVASRAYCHSGEHTAFDRALRRLLDSDCNRLRTRGCSQHSAGLEYRTSEVR
jgi:hypothetical protein